MSQQQQQQQQERNRSRAKKVPAAVTVRITGQGLSSHPAVRLQHLRQCKTLTVYTQGQRANVLALRHVIQQCGDTVQRIHMERRDNDWDAQETTFVLEHVDILTQCLSLDATRLQDWSIVGLSARTVGLDTLVQEALVKIPTLNSVTLKAESVVHTNKVDLTAVSQPLLTAASLQALLTHTTKSIRLAGMFPEQGDYQQVLFDAFVTHGARTHIYIHFAGCKQPSPFCYFLRRVMEWNQKQQQQQQSSEHNMTHTAHQARVKVALLYMARRGKRSTHPFSLDAAYWTIRQNPWLCHRPKQGAAVSVVAWWKRLIPKTKQQRARLCNSVADQESSSIFAKKKLDAG